MKKKKHKLSGKIFRWMCLAVGGSMLLVSALNIFISYQSLTQALETEMEEVAVTASNTIANQIESVQDMVVQLSMDSDIRELRAPSDVRSKCIDTMKNQPKYVGIFVTDLEGKCVNDDKLDFSENPYVKYVVKNKELIVGPVYYSDEYHKTVLEIYAPILTNDMNKILTGVLYAVIDVTIFSDVVGQIAIGETGYAFVIDSNGMVIGHKESEIINQQINYIELAQESDAYKGLDEHLKKAIAGESGFGETVLGGADKFLFYVPIEGTSIETMEDYGIEGSGAWSCVLVATPSEHTERIYLAIIVSVAATVLLFVISLIMILGIIKRMIGPVTKCSERLVQLSEGNLHQEPFDVDKMSNNEIGELGESTNLIAERLNAIIGDVYKLLIAFGEGDLSFRPADVYLGDFAPLRESYAQIQLSLNNTMNNIKKAGSEVSAGSGQVSDAASDLSYGAAKQAASIEQLSASITEISEKVDKNAERANNAAGSSAGAKKLVAYGNDQMHQLLDAMNLIAETSSRIASIIRTIEDISFQTNILALNAAVEAARAGEAGKGFAVVADEVRLLAGKVADAANDTTELIGNSIKSVEQGVELAEKASRTLGSIVKATENITKQVNEISDASNEQAESLRQITAGVEQISSVVQTNSATGEECAASAQQLSSQAVILEKMVSMFTLDYDLLEGKTAAPVAETTETAEADQPVGETEQTEETAAPAENEEQPAAAEDGTEVQAAEFVEDEDDKY
ncbi:MAG: methyl-accepting chemotaxis protein [Eubacterium sp.]|nr:methyl-accepting chemotaxis protein [Eubacterium sp.]